MEGQPHQHFATHTPPPPPRSRHKAASHILRRIGTAKTEGPKKTQNCGDTGSRCLDRPVFGRGGGGNSPLANADRGFNSPPPPKKKTGTRGAPN